MENRIDETSILTNEKVRNFVDEKIDNMAIELLDKLKIIYNGNDNHLHYHNFEHVKNVFYRIIYLYFNDGYEEYIDETEFNCLLYAAAFHDIGYIMGATPETHEEASVIYFKEVYSEYDVPEEYVDIICQLIMATKIEYVPETLGEKLIRDADKLHWAMYYADLAESNIQIINEINFDGKYDVFLTENTKRYLGKYHFEGLKSYGYNAYKTFNISCMENIVKYMHGEESLFKPEGYDLADMEYIFDIKQLEKDKKYLRVADSFSAFSKAKRRKVGAIIVDNNGIVVGTGYNGTPRGTDNSCEDENNVTKSVVIHAEENAIFNSSKLDLAGYTVYCTTEPCIRCSAAMIQKGIKRVVYAEEYSLHDGIEYLKSNGVTVDYIPLERGKY